MCYLVRWRGMLFIIIINSNRSLEKCLTIKWRHNECDGVSNHRRLLIRLYRRKSKKNQSSASLAFVRGIHRWPVNSLHKGPVMRKMFPFDDVIMCNVVSAVSLWVSMVSAGTVVTKFVSHSHFPNKLFFFKWKHENKFLWKNLNTKRIQYEW